MFLWKILINTCALKHVIIMRRNHHRRLCARHCSKFFLEISSFFTNSLMHQILLIVSVGKTVASRGKIIAYTSLYKQNLNLCTVAPEFVLLTTMTSCLSYWTKYWGWGMRQTITRNPVLLWTVLCNFSPIFLSFKKWLVGIL